MTSTRTDTYMTGMLGLYLTAVELVKRGFIVSPTSRSAMGADLLVTDKYCNKAWSVQVKTNSTSSKWWLVGAHAKNIKSDTHIYVFVSIPRSKTDAAFYVVPSAVVSRKMTTFERPNSILYGFDRRAEYLDNWKIFDQAR